MRKILLLLAAVAAATACAGDGAPPGAPAEEGPTALRLPSATVVDLTHAFDEATIFWPTEPPFRREVTADGVTPQGYYYAAGRLHFAEHGGTHIDAPVHFAEGRSTVDEIPLDRLMGPAIVVDVQEQVADNPDYQIRLEDLERWETDHQPIADGTIVLFRTGNGRHWPDRVRYMGTDELGAQAVARLHFPGLHPDAARWLVENRNVKAVGIDTPSIDYGQSQLFETHRILFEADIPAFENVASLDQLPARGALVVALPMKIREGSGGPLRIIAFVP